MTPGRRDRDDDRLPNRAVSEDGHDAGDATVSNSLSNFASSTGFT
jgi:hypothetical protein